MCGEEHSCEQTPELILSSSNSSNQWHELIVLYVASPKAADSPLAMFNSGGFVFNMLITDADIITFPNIDYHVGD